MKIASKSRQRWLTAVAAGLVILLVARGVHLGTSTQTTPLAPENVEDNAECQLRKTGSGKLVECALVVPKTAEEVWLEIANYRPGTLLDAWWGRFEVSAVERTSPEKQHLRGKLVFWLRSLPIDIVLTERSSPSARTLEWRSAGNSFERNEGRWSISSLGVNRTLVRYELDTKLRDIPDWMTHALLVDHLADVVEAIAEPSGEGRK